MSATKPEIDWYDDMNYVKQARAAMKLYEQKGKL